jgi:hypothetical protein
MPKFDEISFKNLGGVVHTYFNQNSLKNGLIGIYYNHGWVTYMSI